MISWIKQALVSFWRVLEASDGGSVEMFEYYSGRLSRLEALAQGELKERISRLETAVLSSDASTSAAH